MTPSRDEAPRTVTTVMRALRTRDQALRAAFAPGRRRRTGGLLAAAVMVAGIGAWAPSGPGVGAAGAPSLPGASGPGPAGTGSALPGGSPQSSAAVDGLLRPAPGTPGRAPVLSPSLVGPQGAGPGTGAASTGAGAGGAGGGADLRPPADLAGAAVAAGGTAGTAADRARWSAAVRAENARPGTAGWRIPAARGRARGLQAYADRVSVAPGESVALYADGAGTVRVRALRMGWYGGTGARTVWSGSLVAVRQPAARLENGPLADAGGLAGTRTFVAPWKLSRLVRTTGWPEGHYLLRLDGRTASRYVPLTVRSTTTLGRLLVVPGTMTWQAYNTWGGRSLYVGAGRATEDRSLAVSFDRPYVEEYGAGRYLYDDAPLVRQAERAGLPLAYVTDYDLAVEPGLVHGAAGLAFGSHSEYWTVPMQQAVASATARGTNLAVFGANTSYWRTRLAGRDTAVPGRPDRRDGRPRTVVVTRREALDPLTATDPGGTTVRFRDSPVASPEERVVGVRFQCSGAAEPWVVTTPTWWGYAGTGVEKGTSLGPIVGSEYDVAQRGTSPATAQVLAYRGFTCKGRRTAHTGVYFTTAGGGGVFAAGTLNWPCALEDGCLDVTVPAAAVARLGRVTRNVLTEFARPAAGSRHPSSPNLARYWLPTNPAIDDDD